MASFIWPSSGSGGGSGTVTSVSVISANGLAGTVANPTSTPAITLSTTVTGLLQGDGTTISPYIGGSLVESTSAVLTIGNGANAVIGTGTTLTVKQATTSQSGYLSSTDWNTFNGKQASGNYITALTGDVTAAGPGSVTSTVTRINGQSLAALTTGILKNTTTTGVPSIAIAADFPTLNQNTSGTAGGLSATLVVGSGGTGVTSVTTTPSVTAFAGWDANKNMSSSNYILGFNSIATAAGTTTLTVASSYCQQFTGSTTQTVLMPVAATLVNGFAFQIINQSTGVVTVQSSGANAIQAMAANTQLMLTCVNIAGGTGIASWSWGYGPIQSVALPVAQGGTGSTTQNFVDISTAQAAIAGAKTFTGGLTSSGVFSATTTSTIANAAAAVGTIGAVSSTATHVINGGLALTTITVTNANRTLDTTTKDLNVFVSTTTTASTITLPAATNGRLLTIKDIGGSAQTNNITITPAAGTIEGAANLKITFNFGFVVLQSNGTNWYVIARSSNISPVASATVTFTGLGTVTNNTCFFQRIADKAYFTGGLTIGTPSGVSATVNFPSGVVIDNTKVSTSTVGTSLGTLFNINVAANGVYTAGFGVALFFDGTTTGSLFLASTGNTSFVKDLGTVYNTGNNMNYSFSVPVSTWGAY